MCGHSTTVYKYTRIGRTRCEMNDIRCSPHVAAVVRSFSAAAFAVMLLTERTTAAAAVYLRLLALRQKAATDAVAAV